MTKMRALPAHPDLPAGTIYDVAPAFAASHNYRQIAVFAEPDEPLTKDLEKQTPNEDDESQPSTPRQRSYKRRDMKAEP